MTTSSPVNAAKIYNFNDYRRKNPLKDRKDGFEGLMRIVKILGVLTHKQRLLLGIICSACFDNGFFDKSKAWLCSEFQGSYPTICRILNQLEKLGFIELSGRGIKFRIFLTELCYIDDPIELKKQYDLIQKEKRKTDTLVLKNDRKSIKNENSTYISSKNFYKNREKSQPEQPPDQDENPLQNDKSQNGPFLKNNFGEYENDIKESCDVIGKLPKKKVPFKPFGLSLSLVRSGISPQAISLALISIIKDWDLISVNPGKCLESRCINQVKWLENKKMINNAEQEERENNLNKSDGTALDVCNRIGFEMKGF